MNDQLRQRLIQFVKPLYQDLDGASRFEDVERVSAIARSLHQPSSETDRDRFELLLLFQRLEKWLERVGNISRTALIVGMEESVLRDILASLKQLHDPQRSEEKALASAMVIDESGVRGLISRFTHARRDGASPMDVALEIASDEPLLPSWMDDEARRWALLRFAERRRIATDLLRESNLEDER